MKFMNVRGIVLCGGFLLGLLHSVNALLVIMGAGHAHGNEGLYLAPIQFGGAALFWYFLPPFQYAFYADVAYRREKKIGLLVALAHYGSGALLIAYLVYIKGVQPPQIPNRNSLNFFLDLVLSYGVFFILNVTYFWRILSKKPM